MKAFFFALFAVASVAFGLAQLFAGYVGLQYLLGDWWAAGAFLGAFYFRTMLPLTIGAFFGAKDVFHWHWAWALLFALPGLAFAVPQIAVAVVMGVRSMFDRQSTTLPVDDLGDELESIWPLSARSTLQQELTVLRSRETEFDKRHP